MGKLADFLTGTQVLEEIDSPINGKITVIRSLAFGTYISVGGLTQSGGVLKDIWRKSLRQVQRTKHKVQRCLILGLGGGTVARLVNEYWPNSKITGVDLDPLMVGMGEKYLGLNKIEIEIEIEDAYEFLYQKPNNKNQKNNLNHKIYNLILIDLYVGDEYPKKFEQVEFINLVKNNLSEEGIAIFNRLYSGDKRPKAMKFSGKLEKIFSKVDVIYPEANVMFICS